VARQIYGSTWGTKGWPNAVHCRYRTLSKRPPERPNFMRQDPFVPCDCGKCFFCLNGITTGIAHPPTKKAKVTVEYKCGTRVTTNKCTDVRVSLGLSSGKYCRMCYRKQLTTELSAKDRQQRCRTSRMGCPICKEPICKECWKEGYDKHA
jgi:hypothetical protein